MDELTKPFSPSIVFVVGSTASGKSDFAINLVQKFGGSIVNCDSVQFYDHLFIGAATPSAEDQKTVPHYLFSYVKPPEEMTAGRFLRDFYELTRLATLEYPLFVVGGTGFYLQALEKGMYDLPEIDRAVKNQIAQEINEHGTRNAYEELVVFDPETRIHRNDGYRIGRALEVKRVFGLRMTEFQSKLEGPLKFKWPHRYLKIGLAPERESLNQRVERRTNAMLARGLIDETKDILASGFAGWSPLASVGYRETVRYLEGDIPLSGLAEMINQSTRQLIKKQRTWFKRDPEVIWSNGSSLENQQLENAVAVFLNKEKSIFSF